MRFYLRNDFPDRPGTYYICWNESGRPQRRSARTRDHGAAQKALAEHILEHDRPRDQRPDQVTLQAVLVRYWHHYGQTRQSRDPIRYTLAKVNKFLEQATVAEFSERPLQMRFIQHLRDDGCNAGTINRYMGVIRSALRWAALNGELPDTKPLARPEPEESAGVPPYTLAEMRKVLEACQTEGERLMVLIWVATLCRPHAALDLTWDRVSDTVIDFKVPGARITKKRRAIVPVAPTLAAYLAERRSVGPVLRSAKHTKSERGIATWKSRFKRVCQRAGVPMRGYGVRKFAATYLRGQGVPEADVAAMLAHRFGGTMTERYAHARPDFMQSARGGIERMLQDLHVSWLPLALASDWQVAGANHLNLLVANSDSWVA